MAQITYYYLAIVLIFIFLGAFNIELSRKYSDVICRETDELPASPRESPPEIPLRENSPESIKEPSDIPENDNNQNRRFLQITSTTENPDEGSVIQVLQKILAILYLINAGFALLATILLWFLSDRPSKRYASPGFFFRCFGVFLRTFFPLMTIVHLIILVLLIVQFYLIQVPGVCTGHSLDHAANVRRDSMVNDSGLVDIVGLCLWVLVHIIGPRVRKCLFIDPFIYEPVDNERNMIIYFCCTSIGL